MLTLPRPRRLSTKFLLLAVPVILASALLFLMVLVTLKSRDLQRVNLAVADQQLQRGTELLGLPVWNIDAPTIHAILDQLSQTDRVHCVRLRGASGMAATESAGACRDPAGLARVSRPVLFDEEGNVRAIGTVEFWVDTSVDRATLLDAIKPLVYLLLVLVTALIVCVLLAFRRTILIPLGRVATSIRNYRGQGLRTPVDWDSRDELGEFIGEYNEGLRRQEQAERELQEQLNFQKALRNALPTPFALVDRDWRLLDANPAFRQELQLAETQSLPSLAEWLPNVDWQAIATLAVGGVHQEEFSAESGPLQGRTFLLAASPHLSPEGGIQGYVLVLQDLTVRIQAERALRRSMAETEKAMSELRSAQQHLVQAEKLASLGSLVAGIAHEINTPIGNSITVATAMSERVEALRHALDNNDLRKSALVDFIADGEQACRILHRALIAAAEQIQKFKQVAVDQSSSQRRRFDLHDTVDEVLSTLRPQLRRTRHQLEVDVPAGIELDSYPGPLGQVIVNCFNNSLLHGFDGIESGCLRMLASQPQPGWVSLILADSGHGIPPENIDRVFDPFFTTRMGRGGSGLGMNLVYTIVTGLLGGRVKVLSAPGEGTQVVVDIPLSAPHDAHAAAEADHVQH